MEERMRSVCCCDSSSDLTLWYLLRGRVLGLGAAAWAFVRAEEGEAEGRAEGSGWREVVAPLEKPLEVLLARLALLLRARADPLAQRLELLLLPVQQLALRAQRLLLPLLLGRRAGARCGARG